MEIFEYDFMIRAFFVGGIVALLASILGMFVVVRRYSMLADSLAHVSLLGVAVGFLSAVPVGVGAIAATVSAAFGIEYLRQRHKLYSDSMLSIFLSGSLGIAIIIVSLSNSFNSSLFDYLFGSIVAVDDTDLAVISIFGVLCLTLIAINYKKLLFTAFDEDVAFASGINTKELNYLLAFLVAVMIGVSIKIVGALLIGALTVIPVVAAMQFGRNFFWTMVIAVSVSVLSVFGGLFLSFYASLPTGATIVVIALVFFCLSIAAKAVRS